MNRREYIFLKTVANAYAAEVAVRKREEERVTAKALMRLSAAGQMLKFETMTEEFPEHIELVNGSFIINLIRKNTDLEKVLLSTIEEIISLSLKCLFKNVNPRADAVEMEPLFKKFSEYELILDELHDHYSVLFFTILKSEQAIKEEMENINARIEMNLTIK